MKKLLIFSILFINFAFTDEIHMTVKTLFTSYDEVLENIEIESITGSRVYYINEAGTSKTLGYSVVNEMIIEYNGQRKVYEIVSGKNIRRSMIINELFGDEKLKNEDGTMKSLEQTDSIIYQPKVKNIKRGRGRLGGAFITVGAFLLFLDIEEEPKSNETAEDFFERYKNSQKIGYGFIIVGGLLLSMGI